MSLTLAGQPLLLAPADLVEHLERHRPLADMHFFGRLAWHERDTRANSRSGMRAGRGVSLTNHSPDPPLAINTFYWPTGASRFARGVFLADSLRIPKILEATGSNASTPVSLVIADDKTGQRIDTKVFLLPLRPLADVPGANGLYLLPVVDERYWWQYCNAGDLSLTTSSTWEDLFFALATALNLDLGQLVGSAADAAYGQPDPTEFSRRYENAAVLLDALAASIGMTIARDWSTGGLIIHNPADATAAVDNALATALDHPYRLAGHEETSSAAHASAIPAKVDVVFPRYCGDFAQCDGSVYTLSKPAPGAAGPAHTRKTFHSTAWASFPNTTDSTPANVTALDALAEKLASDYYAWQGRRYDLSFAGFYPWPANAFDDWIIWRYGTSDDDGEPTIASTRVLSRPLNSGVEEVLQQFDDVPTHENPVRVRLTGTLTAGGNAPARRQEWDGAAYVDVGDPITVYDFTNKQTAANGDKIYAKHWCDRCKYEALVPGQATTLVVFYLNGDLTRGGTASATIQQWAAPPVSGGPWAATGGLIDVYDVCKSGPAVLGDTGIAWLSSESGRYEIIELPSSSSLQLYLFYLNAALPRGGSASANIRQWAAPPLTGGPWAATGAAVTVYDSSSLGPAPKSGDATKQSGVCWLNPDSGRYEVITLTTLNFFLFYLDAAMPKGGSQTAKIREWGAGPGPWADTGAGITVYDSSSLGPAPAGTDATKHSGVCWLSPESERFEVIAVNRSAINWASAQADWVNAPGNGSTVQCIKAIDKDGTPAPGPELITVYLPRPDGGGAKKATDPNVKNGDNIAYVLDDNGDAICISDVNDDCIGSVKWWNKVAGDIPRGWRELSGAAGKFIVAVGPGDANYDPSTLGATGGNSSHTHASHSYTPAGTIGTGNAAITASGSGSATLSGGGVTGSGTSAVTFAASTGATTIDTEYATASLTIFDAGHNHTIASSNSLPNLTFGGSPVNMTVFVATTTGTGTANISVTEPNSGSGHKHQILKTAIRDSITGTVDIGNISSGLSLSGTVTITGMTISASDSGHTHTFSGTTATLTHDTKAHIPPFYALYLIERFE